MVSKLWSFVLLAFYWGIPRLSYPLVRAWYALEWKALRDIRSHKIVRSMNIWFLLVPLAAKAMQELADVVHFQVGDQMITLHTTLPFSWHSLFFAALSFSFGRALVSLMIPSLVLEHRDFAAFERAGKTELHLRDSDRQFESLSSDERDRLMHFAGITEADLAEPTLRAKFWKAFGVDNVSGPWARRLCSSCFALGAYFLFEVFYKGIASVVSPLDVNAYLHQLVLWPVIEWIWNKL